MQQFQETSWVLLICLHYCANIVIYFVASKIVNELVSLTDLLALIQKQLSADFFILLLLLLLP